MKDQLEAGVIEEVNPNSRDGESLYYLPHRAVVRENSETTRTRVVYDASSHAAGVPALNDCLHSGPNLNPDLFNILIRFRENLVAFSGDIEKAFLQISISKEDRDALRFLWVNTASPEDENLKTYRFTRVPFGVTASPFLLAATIRHHIKRSESEEPLIIKMINDGLYVDDLISGADDVKEAHDLSTGASKILSKAGMNLRKWKSNSPALRKLWGLDIEKKLEPTALHPASEKVLGLAWDTNSDSLFFDVHSLLEYLSNREPTKRWVLKAVARIFDPLGLLAPFTVRAKVLFQEVWEQGCSWDDELPPELASKFNDWCQDLKNLRDVVINRYFFGDKSKQEVTSTELHIFVDASERAYAANAYVRYVTRDGKIGTSLVAAKSRVAPLKKLTIPRLELMAAVLGSRLSKHLLGTLSYTPNKGKLWSDSAITLSWIRGHAAQWMPFVSNRVREVQTLTDPQDWHHVKGTENPADLPSRGLKIKDLSKSDLWWKGPTWLQEKGELSFNNNSTGEPLNEEARKELRAAFKCISQNVCAMDARKEPLLDLQRYSSLTKLYRVTAWIRRFVQNCSKGSTKGQPDELTADEITGAEKFWIKQAQRDEFPEEVSALTGKQEIPRTSRLLTLHPVLDMDGIICVGSRLVNSENLTYRERHPWILTSQHLLSKLIAQDQHERVMHAGVNETLVEVRSNFWIIKARQLIKRVVNGCNTCKRYLAKPSVAKMAPLPPTRTTPAPPFENTGLDYAGPLYDSNGNKCYIALFTCAVTRAIHLELVPDMTTDSFLLAFRRFLARRGMVKRIFSDNAKTFKRAESD